MGLLERRKNRKTMELEVSTFEKRWKSSEDEESQSSEDPRG
jgi:hypothetical protein